MSRFRGVTPPKKSTISLSLVFGYISDLCFFYNVSPAQFPHLSLFHSVQQNLSKYNPHLPYSICITITAIKKRHTIAPSICFSYSPSSSSYSFNESSKLPNSEALSQPNDKEKVSDSKPNTFVDEWGKKSEPEPEPLTKYSGPDPLGDDEANDELGGVGVKDDEFGNRTPGSEDDVGESEKLRDLKRAFVDTVYDTAFGFRASIEVRAEALELILSWKLRIPLQHLLKPLSYLMATGFC